MEPKEEIRERLSVVDVVSSYITLKPAGSGAYKALCPFHGEKTPSFHISESKDIWHCFGCDRGGDIFAFVMEMEGISFPEALRLLGKRAGVVIPEYQPRPEDKGTDALLKLHEEVTDFYQQILVSAELGAGARSYIEHRAIPNELVQKFRLGYAPDQWDVCYKAFLKKGYTKDLLLKAGIIKPSKQDVIDRFRDRIMIPLADKNGNIVGFTGRIVKPNDKAPKYLNSPETPIYSKSNILYGLHLAKAAIRANKRVIIVEGNLDVVSSHQAGVEEVVASSGTALTEQQLRTLKKFTDTLVFSFDADNAGFKAAKRGIDLARTIGFNVKALVIPHDLGKDPDDVVKRDPEAWRTICEKPVDIMDLYFSMALKQYDVEDPIQKDAAAQFLLAEVAHIESPIIREHWLQKLSDVLRTPIDVLKRSTPRTVPNPEQPRATKEQNPPKQEPQKVSPDVLAATFLLGLTLMDDSYADDVFARLGVELVPRPVSVIYKEAMIVYTEGKSNQSTQTSFLSRLESHFSDRPDVLPYLRKALFTAQNVTDSLEQDHVRKELNRHIDILKAAERSQKKQALEHSIREAERLGDKQRLESLLKEYSSLL